MEQEFPVPGFSKYTISKEGKVYSYYGKGGSRRQLKEHVVYKRSKSRKYIYYSLQVEGTRRKRQISLPRLMLMAKLGRELKPWEQARHLDGDCNNNHMDNLAVGCVINNLLDDIENGTRKTDAENIDIAIQRLRALRASL